MYFAGKKTPHKVCSLLFAPELQRGHRHVTDDSNSSRYSTSETGFHQERILGSHQASAMTISQESKLHHRLQLQSI